MFLEYLTLTANKAFACYLLKFFFYSQNVSFINVVLKLTHLELLRTLSSVFVVDYVMTMLNYRSCIALDHVRGSQEKWYSSSRNYLDMHGVLEEDREAQINSFLASEQVSIIW
jgi:hypothetical protein